VAGLYALSTDVTALKQVERQLIELARIDSLTGLPNRRRFEEKLREAMARSRRDGRAMALMVLDIDHFKAINDTHGHGIGDAVLKQFASRLNDSVRATDTVARLAGDEFVIILEGLSLREEAERVARKIGTTLRPSFVLGQIIIPVSSSIGIAFLHGEPVSADNLIAKADDALYEAKRAGRNTFAVSNW
jgi:diguanylate cyclase (GGDEF)-like protein